MLLPIRKSDQALGVGLEVRDGLGQPASENLTLRVSPVSGVTGPVDLVGQTLVPSHESYFSLADLRLRGEPGMRLLHVAVEQDNDPTEVTLVALLRQC